MMPMVSSMASVTRGGGASTDSQTVTNGSTSTGSEPIYYYNGFSSGVTGSCADGTSNLYAGAAILKLYFTEIYSSYVGYVYRAVMFEVNGTVSNTGWATMTVDGTVYNRADAAFSSSGGVTSWTWVLTIPNQWISGAPGPFEGASSTVAFA